MDTHFERRFPGVVDPEMRACWTAQPVWGAAIGAVWGKDLAMMRLLFNQGRTFWNDGTPALPRVVDFTLPRPQRPIPLRLYDPVGDGQARPAMVFLHGGGYVVGTLDTHDTLCRALAQASGMNVVAVDYALAPEFKFPFAIEEAAAVGRFLQAMGRDWGIDPARVALGGDSAGAAIAMGALLSQTLAGDRLFAAGWLVYGAYGSEDTESRRTYSGDEWGLTPAYRRFYREAYFSDPAHTADPRFNLLQAKSLAGLPPIFLAPSEMDPLRDDSFLLADRLRAEGVPVELKTYLGCYHGFLHMTQRLQKARDAIADCASWMGRVLA